MPLRASRAVVLRNGDVLLVAGSGMTPGGPLKSAVYHPAKGTYTMLKTPADFFRAGMVQLPDGKVLILGGTKAYQTAAHGDEGSAASYLFDPATGRYQKIGSLPSGRWLPSATELGNGDVIAYGGLNGTSEGAVRPEYFRYNPASPTDGSWLPAGKISKTSGYWGLLPAMILTQSGQLFYTGSHDFGDNETPAGPLGTKRGQGGAGLIDISHILTPAASTPVTVVTGLQDTPGGPAGTDMTDESMSVLLPPAQDQKVLLLGGGNAFYEDPATRLTDLISLTAATPAYTAGPLLPQGKLFNGKTEPAADGKMDVSAVDLPNGQVLETGGALLRAEDPVYEASMYNPATGKFTAMATDPVSRTWFSSSFLLPSGQVMTVGNEGGNGAFDERVSVYSPPYLFHGTRPTITSTASTFWTYGSAQPVTATQKIISAELIRPASVTQSADPNQRSVNLPVTVSGGHLTLTVTSNPDLAPPGWYMLFVNNASGVPSTAKWVHLARP